MHIHLHYRAAQRIDQPVFGLAIHHQNGSNIFGPNTKFGGLEIPYAEGEGVVVYTIPKLPLLEGGYAISVAVVDDADTQTFDYHDRAYTFQVYSGEQSTGYGMVKLDGHWRWHEPIASRNRSSSHRRGRQLTVHENAADHEVAERLVRPGL